MSNILTPLERQTLQETVELISRAQEYRLAVRLANVLIDLFSISERDRRDSELYSHLEHIRAQARKLLAEKRQEK